MANYTNRVLWCFIKGDSTAFRVAAPGKASIDEVKNLVWEKEKNGVLCGTDAKNLVLWKASTEQLTYSSQLLVA